MGGEQVISGAKSRITRRGRIQDGKAIQQLVTSPVERLRAGDRGGGGGKGGMSRGSTKRMQAMKRTCFAVLSRQ